MKPISIALGGLLSAVGATGAYAAALEQAVPSTTRILFQEGTYAEFGVTWTDPDQSGSGGVIPGAFSGGPDVPFTGDTGDLFESYWSYSAAFKNNINDRLSYALIFDQPYGSDTEYGPGSNIAGPGPYPYADSSANLDAYQITGILAYDATEQVKVYGGLRAQRIDANASLLFVGPTVPPPLGPLPGYTVEADSDWGYGYLVGGAYARPELGLRVALTYYSRIETEHDTLEFGSIATETTIETPQQVILEGQTGINPKTLLFGSVRWVDWSEFEIAPPIYTQVLGGRPLVSYEDDWWTYNLGVARQFTDALAGSLSVTYEPSVDIELTTLGPYDGRTFGTAALSYDYERFNVTGGVSYGTLGDATNVLNTDFDDGSFLALGLRVGVTF